MALFLAEFFQDTPLGILAAVILVAILPSAKNVQTILTLFKKAQLDSQVFRENLKNPPNSSRQETSASKSALEDDDVIIESTHQETCQSGSSNTRDMHISSTNLIEKTTYSLHLCEYIIIWSDFITWLVTFLAVLLIDVSAGIYAGLIVVIFVNGIRAFTLLREEAIMT